MYIRNYITIYCYITLYTYYVHIKLFNFYIFDVVDDNFCDFVK